MIREWAEGEPSLTPESLADLISELAPGLSMMEAIMFTGSVTAAAGLCGVSQPTLTRRMARWEEAADIALFERSTRHIGLTVAGRELGEAVASILETLRITLERRLAQSASHRLLVASLQSLGQSVVAELVAGFLNQNPSESLRLVEESSKEICEGVKAGRYDLGVVDQPPDLAGFTWCPLGRQSLSLVLPANHPHTDHSLANLRDFSDYQFVALDRRYHSRINADILCREAGFAANILLESDDPARLRHYVGEGRGIAILPCDLSINPRVRTIPIDSSSATREFGVIVDSRRQLSSPVEAFLASVRLLGEQYPGWADLLDS